MKCWLFSSAVWAPFLAQISLLGIETITSALEHRVYVLTLTELHPHRWSGICLAPQRRARCKYVSRNKLSTVPLKPLCFTWNHGQDTEKKQSLKYFCAPDAGRWRASFTTSAAPHKTGLSTIPAQTIPARPGCRGKGTAARSQAWCRSGITLPSNTFSQPGETGRGDDFIIWASPACCSALGHSPAHSPVRKAWSNSPGLSLVSWIEPALQPDTIHRMDVNRMEYRDRSSLAGFPLSKCGLRISWAELCCESPYPHLTLAISSRDQSSSISCLDEGQWSVTGFNHSFLHGEVKLQHLPLLFQAGSTESYPAQNKQGNNPIQCPCSLKAYEAKDWIIDRGNEGLL